MSSQPPPSWSLIRSADTAAKLGGDCNSKVFLVTGAYSGLGAETVKALLRVGAKVIVAGRNPILQQQFIESLKKDFDELQVDGSHTVDLADLKSVQDFAAHVLKTYTNLVLICNAGIMNTPPGVTKNGFEQQIGVNVIGHFLLAKKLVGVTSRQVWLSSWGHTLKGGPRLDLERIRTFKVDDPCYDGWRAYQQSKLGNILLSKEFDKRYPHLEAVSLHPGVIYTPLYRDTGIVSAIKLTGSLVSALVNGELSQAIPKLASAGAATTVTCATLPSDQLVSGAYYSNCAVYPESEAAKNEDDAAALFDFCDQATKDFQ